MSTSVVFQISLYCLTGLTGITLVFAEENWWPASITIPMAAIAFVFVERRNRLVLPTLWANLLGLAIFCVAGYESMGGSDDARVIALSHLLVYLTWLVLFQEKHTRQYWLLFALSMLQVAMGSLLTYSGWHGILLVLYVVGTVWTLAVFMLHQAQKRFALPPQSSKAHATTATSGARRGNFAAGSVLYEGGEPWVTPRFVGGVATLAVSAIAFSTVLYLMVPVAWTSVGGRYARLNDSPLPPLTGFTENVRLGDMGEILENSDPVMKVRLLDYDTDAPQDIIEYAQKWGYDAPLFRGAVLETYQDGRWSPIRLKAFAKLLDTRPREGKLRLEVIVQPIGTQVLFTMHPCLSGYVKNPEQVGILVQPETEILNATARPSRQPIEYRTIFEPNVPPPGSERSVVGVSGMFKSQTHLLRMIKEHREECLQFPEHGLNRLRDLARQLIPQADAEGGDSAGDLAKARALESYLRDSGVYTYTLNAAVDDPKIDPVEDFLFNRKTGHCEYYASALALMLRAVGIPSRLVTGFKGGFYGSYGGYYEVQQRHAHSWVEAFVGDEWITLDGTPSVDREDLLQRYGRRSFFQSANELMSGIWGTYVINMTASNQMDSIYTPLQAALRGSWDALRDLRTAVTELVGWVRAVFSSPQRWFSWDGGLAVFVLLLSLTAFVWLIRRVVSIASTIRGRVQRRREAVVRIEFLERFVKLLSEHGIPWLEGQTSREFARVAQDKLSAQLEPSGLSAFPTELTDLYYRVRFGDISLSASEISSLQVGLAKLEQSLRNR